MQVPSNLLVAGQVHIISIGRFRFASAIGNDHKVIAGNRRGERLFRCSRNRSLLVKPLVTVQGRRSQTVARNRHTRFCRKRIDTQVQDIHAVAHRFIFFPIGISTGFAIACTEEIIRFSFTNADIQSQRFRIRQHLFHFQRKSL